MECKICEKKIDGHSNRIQMTTICNSCQRELDDEFENRVKNREFTLKDKKYRDELNKSNFPNDWIVLRDWDFLNLKKQIKGTSNEVHQNNNEVHESVNKELEKLEQRIREANEPPKYSTEPINFETDEKKPTTIERLKKYTKKLTPQKISKASQLRKLKIKYPHPNGAWGYKDRDERQYSKLVSTIELHVAEFVLKWEYEHQHRIHKDLAWELLTERIDNGKISDEFLEKMSQKYV